MCANNFFLLLLLSFTIQLVALVEVCLPEEMCVGEINGRLNIAG